MGYPIKSILVTLSLLQVTGWSFSFYSSPNTLEKQDSFAVYSLDFSDQGFIPERYTCDGENVNPPLHIKAIPAHTKSMALIVEDLDATSDDQRVHWLVWGILRDTHYIPASGLPKGAIEGQTDFDWPAWGGPCPVTGTHRYIFRLLALDQATELKPRSNFEELEHFFKGHVLAETHLIGLYEREKTFDSTFVASQKNFQPE